MAYPLKLKTQNSGQIFHGQISCYFCSLLTTHPISDITLYEDAYIPTLLNKTTLNTSMSPGCMLCSCNFAIQLLRIIFPHLSPVRMASQKQLLPVFFIILTCHKHNSYSIYYHKLNIKLNITSPGKAVFQINQASTI